MARHWFVDVEAILLTPIPAMDRDDRAAWGVRGVDVDKLRSMIAVGSSLNTISFGHAQILDAT